MVSAVSFSQTAPVFSGKVHIPAQLFRADAYPDKGVTITPEDLDGICKRFSASGQPVPIRLEHIETPLDPLGHVVALHREGDLLFGTLAFPVGLYSHIQERRADKVSLGLHVVEDENGKGYQMKECSLVFTPRVQGAGFLSPDQIATRLASLQASGKITPAMVAPAAKLFSLGGGSLQFSDGSQANLSALLDELFLASPVVQVRGGQVPTAQFSAPSNESVPALSGEAAKMANTLGLDPARVAKIKKEMFG